MTEAYNFIVYRTLAEYAVCKGIVKALQHFVKYLTCFIA